MLNTSNLIGQSTYLKKPIKQFCIVKQVYALLKLRFVFKQNLFKSDKTASHLNNFVLLHNKKNHFIRIAPYC